MNNSPRNVDSTKSVLQSDKPKKSEKSDNSNLKDSKKSEKASEKLSEVNKNELQPKNDKLTAKSLTSVQSVNVAGNDIENVKTLISEDSENQEEESKDVSESNKDLNAIGDTKQQGKNETYQLYLSYQLHCCAWPDKRCLPHGMLLLSGHDDVALFE